jgi:DNA polymerase III epsilon subunit-like protein
MQAMSPSKKKSCKGEKMKLQFIDAETTGLPKDWKAPVTDSDNWPRCVEVACISKEYRDGAWITVPSSFLIKPIGFDIPKDATAVHGITTEQALEFGVAPGDIFPEIHKRLLEANFMVGHNIGFDLKIMNAEFHRLGLPIVETKDKALCTMMSGRRYTPTGKWPKLEELYMALFGKPFEGAHRASVDISATEQCFNAMIESGDIKIPEIAEQHGS